LDVYNVILSVDESFMELSVFIPAAIGY